MIYQCSPSHSIHPRVVHPCLRLQISVEGVFKTSAEKIVSEDPVGADFNPKAYACMGALPNYDKLIRSSCLDKVSVVMGGLT